MDVHEAVYVPKRECAEAAQYTYFIHLQFKDAKGSNRRFPSSLVHAQGVYFSSATFVRVTVTAVFKWLSLLNSS